MTSAQRQSRIKQMTPAQQSASTAVPGLGVIVMAAGLGKRMQSKRAKVLHPVAGKPMVSETARVRRLSASSCGPSPALAAFAA